MERDGKRVGDPEDTGTCADVWEGDDVGDCGVFGWVASEAALRVTRVVGVVLARCRCGLTARGVGG